MATQKQKKQKKASPVVKSKPVPIVAAGFLKEIKQFEGIVPYMYRDSADEGYVTVGIGFNIDQGKGRGITAEGLDMPFVVRGSSEQPTPEKLEEMIKAEFSTVKKHPCKNAKGQALAASAYKSVTKLDLKQEYIDQRFDDLVADRWSSLHKEYPLFDRYPMPVQYALLDMIFNMGRGGDVKDKKGKVVKRTGIHQYLQLRAALDKEDWKGAGASSNRKEVGTSRNKRIKEWFDAGENWLAPGSLDSMVWA